MTHDERISSYIDNELSGDQEQEFLISLAASDALRKSFRSELVLKKVLHRDEMATNPPRRMRGAVFAAVGLASATAGAGLVTSTAKASQAASASASVTASSVIKSLFATKLSTLITAAGISLSAVAGYGVHEVVVPNHDATTVSVPVTQNAGVQHQTTIPATDQVAPVGNTTGVNGDASSSQAEHAPSSLLHQRATNAATARNSARVKASESTNPATVRGAAGGGSITSDPPVINGK